MRPSALSLAANCAASWKLSRGFGSEASVQGTAFHEMAHAKILNNPLDYEIVQKKYNLTDDAIAEHTLPCEYCDGEGEWTERW